MNNSDMSTMEVEPFHSLPLSAELIAELRSDHAGEAGAVEIYRGMLSVSRDDSLRRFANSHLAAERRHLRFFDEWLPKRCHSRLLPVWRAAGWLLGAVSALFGARAAFRTVSAVETFVEQHYLAQLEALNCDTRFARLSRVLRSFCDDEIHHRDDAARRIPNEGGPLARGWARLISQGSVWGVRIARRV